MDFYQGPRMAFRPQSFSESTYGIYRRIGSLSPSPFDSRKYNINDHLLRYRSIEKARLPWSTTTPSHLQRPAYAKPGAPGKLDNLMQRKKEIDDRVRAILNRQLIRPVGHLEKVAVSPSPPPAPHKEQHLETVIPQAAEEPVEMVESKIEVSQPQETQ